MFGIPLELLDLRYLACTRLIARIGRIHMCLWRIVMYYVSWRRGGDLRAVHERLHPLASECQIHATLVDMVYPVPEVFFFT